MDADEARELDMTLRQLRIPGVVAPEDPEDPQGAWRVYDEADPDARRDITADVLVAVAAARQRQRRGPTRGFVIPRVG
ncbi:hypothetical protein ACFXPI_11600 [Streptomyces sp. NPDC059104]|uniref:hypothetical protein n=1 Tax=Streptomyces sp. NPDC059104 TaxID=3346729 RepID=UPI0036B0E3C4